MTHLAFYAGLLGISLIVLTFFETYVAGSEMRKQSAIASKTARAEFQPYLKFSDEIELSGLNITRGNDDAIIGANAYGNDNSFQIEPRVTVTNKGKTPATRILVSHTGRIFNRSIEFDEAKNRSIVSNTYDFDGYRIGPSYLGPDDEVPLSASTDIVYDRVKNTEDFERAKSGTWENTSREITFLNSSFRFNIVVSFQDQFTDRRRAFLVVYFGKIIDGGPKLAGVRELATTDQEYKQNQDALERFEKFTKDFPAIKKTII